LFVLKKRTQPEEPFRFGFYYQNVGKEGQTPQRVRAREATGERNNRSVSVSNDAKKRGINPPPNQTGKKNVVVPLFF